MDKSRRRLLGAGLSSAASLALAGTKHFEPISAAGTAGAIDLWPTDRIPGGPGPGGPERLDGKGAVTNVSRPRLNVYVPKRPNGTAVLVVAGGGYTHIELGAESTPACLWLQSVGIVAFELVYRLPRDGWSPMAPLQDGQRAMRILRSTASSYGVDPNRIGLIGFSAGGHLSGMTAVSGATERYPKVDETDRTSPTPDFAGLIYPVLSLMPPFDRTETRRQLVGRHPDLERSAELSVDQHVSPSTCPIFLAQAKDDPVSPIDNSLLMFNALRKNDIPSELHVFQAGGHGWGMGQPGTPVHAWPKLFISWLRFNNLLVTDA
ncbi:alpha/beta hydrolase [Trinickia dabaoshanensis]|uniref:Alpha/beta hydrolase n=1 Tax=Trinickia dabaoshanensis TaxID=564714 RepID=A0A2N7VL13_9BURK|nr:alpha/beta hydrolase [Trinickia dabaoshanensis]PMS17827.1 alpha/beta hydrolase [Trinickia dabaoshanensis]